MNNSVELKGILKEGYGIVPKLLMKDHDLTPYDKVLMCYFLSYCGGGKSECFPSYDKIKADLNISKDTIAKSLKRLCDKGYLKREPLYPEDKMRRNNKYTILLFEAVPEVSQTESGIQNDGITDSVTSTSNNNSINNNIINNKESVSSDLSLPITIKKQTAETEFKQILSWFHDKYGTLPDYKIDGKAIKTLQKRLKFDQIKVYIAMYWKLINKRTSKIYGKPFTPSSLITHWIYTIVDQEVKKITTRPHSEYAEYFEDDV